MDWWGKGGGGGGRGDPIAAVKSISQINDATKAAVSFEKWILLLVVSLLFCFVFGWLTDFCCCCCCCCSFDGFRVHTIVAQNVFDLIKTCPNVKASSTQMPTT